MRYLGLSISKSDMLGVLCSCCSVWCRWGSENDRKLQVSYSC